MSIDIEKEKLLGFAELARSLPRRRRGRPVNVSTIHRWRSNGLQGIRLEAVCVGGSWCTTLEAFARFCGRLTAARDQGSEREKSARPGTTDAVAELADHGW